MPSVNSIVVSVSGVILTLAGAPRSTIAAAQCRISDEGRDAHHLNWFRPILRMQLWETKKNGVLRERRQDAGTWTNTYSHPFPYTSISTSKTEPEIHFASSSARGGNKWNNLFVQGQNLLHSRQWLQELYTNAKVIESCCPQISCRTAAGLLLRSVSCRSVYCAGVPDSLHKQPFVLF